MTTARLYISPLTPSLLDSIIPPALRLATHNVSFHSVETFPEKSYGYVDVPVEEAQKLKRKLNGYFLKGMKVRVEDARPEARKRKAAEAAVEEAEIGDSAAGTEQVQRPKRSKREKMDGVLAAVELPKDRQVKRGWVEKGTDDKQNKHKKSKDVDKIKDKKVDRSQMLFRAALPPNVASKSTDLDKKSKKKNEKSERAKSAVEVKEFEKTTRYPTFLRDTTSTEGSIARSYIDGKGWVDENGHVVEAEKPKKKRKAAPEPMPEVVLPVKAPMAAPEQALSATSDSDSSISSIVSSSVSDSSSSEDDDDVQSPDVKTPSSITSNSNLETPNTKSSTTKSRKAVIQSSTTSPLADAEPSKEVHPLEALFKRPAPTTVPTSPPTDSAITATNALLRSTPRPAPIVTSFNFFDPDHAHPNLADAEQLDADDEALSSRLPQIPVTPFTKRDLEARGMRSAAPTPDTAAVGKRLPAPWLGPGAGEERDVVTSEEDDQDDDDDNEAGDDEVDDDETGDGDDTFAEARSQDPTVSSVGGAAQGTGQEQSEFEKHFWANRGEYNRSWKARKREARKEARQAENRRSGRLR